MKWAAEIGTWVVCGALLFWALGGKERVDCSVLRIEAACEKISADYASNAEQTKHTATGISQ